MENFNSKETIPTKKDDGIKEIKFEDFINDTVKGSDKIIKLNMKVEYEDNNNKRGSFLIEVHSLKIIHPEKTWNDPEVVMFDAFKKETVVDMKTCKNPLLPWNFMQENIKDEKTIKFQEEWCKVKRIFNKSWLVQDISDSVTKEELEILNYFNTNFIRVGNDEFVEYGDGGRMIICTPLYYNKQLPLDQTIKQNLTTQLNKLGEERNDWHEECPVLDIIDPDLNPNYLAPKNMEQFLEESKKIALSKGFYRKGEEEEYAKSVILTKFPDSLSLRSRYKWIPTDILIDKDMKAKFLGPIHNLPMKNISGLYANILKVFEAMLPGFKKLNLLQENGETKLQVIIKAQKYEIKPGMKYLGKWHIEGKTENIVAGGVYYCNIDKGFQEDKLTYRNYVFPDPGYAEDLHRVPDYDIDVMDGTAVVFSNTLPHKFNQLANSTKETITRTFLNFFIVDPSDPIYSETGMIEHWRLLKSKKLKNIIVGHVLKFLYLSYDNIDLAKEKRSKVREAMKTEKSGWGFIHYGNSGDVEFFDAFHQPVNTAKYEENIDNA